MLVSRIHAPVRNQTLRVLRDAIIDGRFKPGSRLIERELCEFTGVSRTSIREALRQLESEGLIKLIPNKGPIVATLTLEEAKNIYEVRKVMEGLACRLFAERATPSQTEALSRAVELYEKACRRGGSKDLIQAIHAKNKFYEIILKGCRNKIVHSFITSLHARITYLRSASLSRHGRPVESLAEIKAILEAIKQHDAEAAWNASINHVSKAETAALEALNHK
jgi:DNA-binding GntR family transcriptional regulator